MAVSIIERCLNWKNQNIEKLVIKPKKQLKAFGFYLKTKINLNNKT